MLDVGFGQPGVEMDACDLAVLDRLGVDRLFDAACVRVGDRGILSVQGQLFARPFSGVGAEPDVTKIEESGEPGPFVSRHSGWHQRTCSVRWLGGAWLPCGGGVPDVSCAKSGRQMCGSACATTAYQAPPPFIQRHGPRLMAGFERAL